VFSSQREAKAFFVERIVAQAEAEGGHLSANERWMLGFSESDPDFAVDSARVEQLEAEIPEKDYETKIAGLLQRAYQADAEADGGAPARFREASAALRQGDHYLLIMLDRLLQPVTPGTAAVGVLAQVGLFVLLVVPGTVAVLMAFGVIAMAVSERELPISAIVAIALGAGALEMAGYYLIHLWRRERNCRRVAA
jgi:hypothetical protein